MQTKSLKERKSEIARQKLLEATKMILENYGEKQLTVRNICAESGVSSGSFYHHFGTKENLIVQYMRGLYFQVVRENPIPDFVKTEAYAGEVLWPFLVYAKFCEAAGTEIIQFLLTDCCDDIFYDITFRPEVIPLAKEFVKRSLPQDKSIEIIYDDVAADLEMIYKGIIVSWCLLPKRTGSGRSMCQDMEHLIFRFLLSFARSEIVESIEIGQLITERPEFDSFFHMDNVKIANSRNGVQ
ncbi:MAG: TetR/AcrR family transcriptional regulator [Lachnospiraceae bacterium]|nr:TetR/AcrR family transcriptional regulator [Lachnospiraceae bacterium]